MKKFLFLAVTALCIYSCSGDSFKIEGTAPADFNDQMVYLKDHSDGDKTLDSTTVVNGTFTLKGKANPMLIAHIDLANTHANVILEKGTITFDFSDPNTVTGTPLNEALSDFNKKYSTAMTEGRDEYNKLVQEFGATPEVLQEKMEEFNTRYESSINTLFGNFFEANKDNVLGAVAFTILAGEKSFDEVDALYNQLAPAVQETPQVKDVLKEFESLKATAVGQKFTDFTIEEGNVDGTTAKLSDYVGKGKYVLVDFWASWCGPCIREFPHMKDIYAKHKGDNFEILGVAVWDEREKSIEAISRHEIPWPTIVNGQRIPSDLYGFKGIPQIILFGPDGTILARDLRGDAMAAKIVEVLQ